MIGSGIFRKPAIMALNLGSPELLIAVWIFVGLITLFGALSNAEVAGMISSTGGQYEYFRAMYGDFIAYLYGWSIFAVIQTGSIASISYVFAEYTQYFVHLPRFSADIEKSFSIIIPFLGDFYPLENIGVKIIAISVILGLSAVNYFGVKFGGAVSTVFTSLKLLALALLFIFAISYPGGSTANFTKHLSGFEFNLSTLISGIIIAVSGAFWAYDGWNNITFISGEVDNPKKNIPKTLFIGTVIVVAIYAVINLAFLYVLPIDEIAKSKLVASDVAMRAIGGIGAAFIAGSVMLSTFGSSNGSILASSRVVYAMSRRNMFFSFVGKKHKKFGTPSNSLIIQALWASLLVLSGTFDVLTDMLIFVSWIFYCLGAIGVFVLRKKMPDTPRPYKVLGYPVIPAIFVAFAAIFVIFTIYNDFNLYLSGKSNIINSIFGLVLVCIGIPFYFYLKKGKLIILRTKKLINI